SLGTLAIVAQILLVLGIVEGSALIGWRLTQLPKSQALEFLLVSPVSSREVFAAELAVGLGRFLLVQLAALPALGLAVFSGLADADARSVPVRLDHVPPHDESIRRRALLVRPRLRAERRLGTLLESQPRRAGGVRTVDPPCRHPAGRPLPRPPLQADRLLAGV